MLRQGLSTDTQAHICSASYWVAEKDPKRARRQDSSNSHQISPALSIKMLHDHLLASVNSASRKKSALLSKLFPGEAVLRLPFPSTASRGT